MQSAARSLFCAARSLSTAALRSTQPRAQRVCRRSFSTDQQSTPVQQLGSSNLHAVDIPQHVKDSSNREKEERELFARPGYFDTNVLMLHCQFTDFACSYHQYDKLDEMECLWSCFPCDLKIYGSRQRVEEKTVQMIMARARVMLKQQGVTQLRIVVKGYSNTLGHALRYLDKHCQDINFVSITDLTRTLGQESIVYQRPVPHYPNKRKVISMMNDGPEFAPKTLLEKFSRLNSYHLDEGKKGLGLLVKSSEEQKATKHGFILKKSKTKNRPAFNTLTVTKKLD